MADATRYAGLPTDIATAITRFELACYDLAEAVTDEGTAAGCREVNEKRQALVEAIKASLKPAALPAAQTITLTAPERRTPSLDEVLHLTLPPDLAGALAPVRHLAPDDTEGGAL
jgi:hypothetical protein